MPVMTMPAPHTHAPAASYRESGGRERLEFFAVLAAWWAMMFTVFALLPHDVGGGVGAGLLLALGALALAPLLLLGRWQRRRRALRVRAALLADGWSVRTEPSEPEREAALAQVGRLALLRHETRHVDWIARRHLDGVDLTVLRHSHLDGGGKTVYDRTSLVVALSPADPRPGVWLTRTNVLTARRDEDAGYTMDLQTGDAWLDTNFRVQAADAEPLARLLTPAVRQHLALGPPKESWTIGWGYVVCVFGGDTSPEGLRVMVERTRAMAGLLRLA